MERKNQIDTAENLDKFSAVAGLSPQSQCHTRNLSGLSTSSQSTAQGLSASRHAGKARDNRSRLHKGSPVSRWKECETDSKKRQDDATWISYIHKSQGCRTKISTLPPLEESFVVANTDQHESPKAFEQVIIRALPTTPLASTLAHLESSLDTINPIQDWSLPRSGQEHTDIQRDPRLEQLSDKAVSNSPGDHSATNSINEKDNLQKNGETQVSPSGSVRARYLAQADYSNDQQEQEYEQAEFAAMDRSASARGDEGLQTPDVMKQSFEKPDPLTSESSDSMPSDVSSLIISDTGAVINGVTDWGTPHPDDDWSTSAKAIFIKSWSSDIPRDIRASFLDDDTVKDQHFRDVDVTTGELLDAVQYPKTFPDLLDDPCLDPDAIFKQLNWTAALLIHRACNRDQPFQAGMGNATVPDLDKVEQEAEIEIVSPFAPTIPCFMRPAQVDDMEGVTAIYNLEVTTGSQALDNEELAGSHFSDILEKTEEANMPFVVMIKGKPEQVPKTDEEIIGFGFLSIWQPGLAGSWLGGSRMHAMINVYVHPDYRKKRVGFSLLDKLVSVASENYSSAESYVFVDPSQKPLYNTDSSSHSRQYFKLYVHYRVPSTSIAQKTIMKSPSVTSEEPEDEATWLQDFLQYPFRFERETTRLRRSHRTRATEGNPPIFLDSLIFEHQCVNEIYLKDGVRDSS